MAAQWKATFRRPNCLKDYVYFCAADARSMKPKHLRAAVVNARKRAKAKLLKQGVKDAEILAVNCVG